MMSGKSHAPLARLVFLLAGVSGVIGILAGFNSKTWKLGVEGWLTLCAAGMLGSLVLMADWYIRTKGASK